MNADFMARTMYVAASGSLVRIAPASAASATSSSIERGDGLLRPGDEVGLHLAQLEAQPCQPAFDSGVAELGHRDRGVRAPPRRSSGSATSTMAARIIAGVGVHRLLEHGEDRSSLLSNYW